MSLWTEHERLRVPCVVHPAPRDTELAPGDVAQMRQWDLDLVVGFASDETLVVAQFVFGGILDRHPALRLHIPHAGGNAPWLKGRFEMALRKRPWAKDLLIRSLDDVWQQMCFDCLIKPGPTMEFLVKAEGPDRILLGTNFAGWDQDDTIVASVESAAHPGCRPRPHPGGQCAPALRRPRVKTRACGGSVKSCRSTTDFRSRT